jgi:DNA gyrase subunit B
MSKKKPSIGNKKASQEAKYSAKNIQKLEPREHIRRRPGMYIGGTGKRALHFLAEEVLNTSIDSVFAGKCDTITVRLQPDNCVTISDNSEFIPERLAEEDYRPNLKMYVMDMIFSEVGIGPRYIYAENGYIVSGSWYGVGIVAVNALSTSFDVTVYHKNTVWKRSYQKGKPHGEYLKYESSDEPFTGVTITFQPDFSIFDENDFDYDLIANRCKEIAYIFPELTITLIDERTQPNNQDVFHYPDGIQSMVSDLDQTKQPLHDIVYKREVVTYTDSHNNAYDTIVEIAFQYAESDETILRGYTNTVLATEGGTHIEGFRHALMGYINSGHEKSIEWEKLSQGLIAIISVSHCQPYYESMTNLKLLNPDIFDAVLQTTYALLVESNLRNTIRKYHN